MIETFPVIAMPLDALRPDPDAVMKHSDAEMQRLVGVIGEYGQILPVIWNERLSLLVAGEEVVEALTLLGEPHALALVVDLGEDEHALASIAARAPYGKRDKAKVTERLCRAVSHGADGDLCGLETWRVEEMLGQREPKERKPRVCPKCGTEIGQ